MALIFAEKKNGVISFNEETKRIFWRDYADDFFRRLEKRLAKQAEYAANPHAHCLKCGDDNRSDAPICAACVAAGAVPAFKRGTCAVCDAPVQVVETEELPMTCEQAACVARLARIAQRLGAGS